MKPNAFFYTYLIRYIGLMEKRERVKLFINLLVNISSTCKKEFLFWEKKEKISGTSPGGR